MFLDHAGSCRRGCLDLVADVTRYALIAALVALCAALGGLWWQSGRMGSLQADNDRLTRSNVALTMTAQQNAIARDVAKASADRQASIAAAARADVEAILTGEFGECSDALLPDNLRAILDGLRLDY